MAGTGLRRQEDVPNAKENIFKIQNMASKALSY
jgi:hypothetical protein